MDVLVGFFKDPLNNEVIRHSDDQLEIGGLRLSLGFGRSDSEPPEAGASATQQEESGHPGGFRRRRRSSWGGNDDASVAAELAAAAAQGLNPENAAPGQAGKKGVLKKGPSEARRVSTVMASKARRGSLVRSLSPPKEARKIHFEQDDKMSKVTSFLDQGRNSAQEQSVLARREAIKAAQQAAEIAKSRESSPPPRTGSQGLKKSTSNTSLATPLVRPSSSSSVPRTSSGSSEKGTQSMKRSTSAARFHAQS